MDTENIVTVRLAMQTNIGVWTRYGTSGRRVNVGRCITRYEGGIGEGKGRIRVSKIDGLIVGYNSQYGFIDVDSYIC